MKVRLFVCLEEHTDDCDCVMCVKDKRIMFYRAELINMCNGKVIESFIDSDERACINLAKETCLFKNWFISAEEVNS